MGGGGSKYKSSAEKELAKEMAKKFNVKSKENNIAASILASNIRIWLSSYRRLTSWKHSVIKLFLEYSSRNVHENDKEAQLPGFDRAHDELLSKRCTLDDFRRLSADVKVAGKGEKAKAATAADAVFLKFHKMAVEAAQKKLRQKELEQGLRRGSLKAEVPREINWQLFNKCIAELAYNKFKGQSKANARVKFINQHVIKFCPKFKAEKKALKADEFSKLIVASLRLNNNGKSPPTKGIKRGTRRR